MFLSLYLINACIFWILPLSCGIACLLCVWIITYFIFRNEGIKNKIGIALSDKTAALFIAEKENLIKAATSEENVDKIMPEIENHIQTFLTVKVPQELPMIAMFLGEKTTNQIKDVFIKELRTLFPKVIGQYIDTATDEGKIKNMILQKSETIMSSIYSKELRYFLQKIKIYSFVSGLIIGTVISLLLFLFA